VVFAGPVHGEEKWKLLRSAALVALPSYSENFGMAAMEAMAVGRPVVVTPEVGIADIVLESDSGIVVDGAPEIMGPAIDALLNDTGQLKSKGNNGRRIIEKRYTWDHIASEMRNKYEEILRRT
jgi:glycosyltransferase involved in cell wall biosynthesis